MDSCLDGVGCRFAPGFLVDTVDAVLGWSAAQVKLQFFNYLLEKCPGSELIRASRSGVDYFH